MKPIKVTYKCMKHITEDCIKEWQEYTVNDPPYYKECKNCFEKDCEEERELISDLD